MKLAIQQPYFFPYIGYWQLINLVDKFVIYDDVNYIKGGWINRNRILINNKISYFNVPMIDSSPNIEINKVKINCDERIIRKNIKTITYNYSKAPYFDKVFPILEEILYRKSDNLASFLTDSIKDICKYLNISTEILISSEIEKRNELKGKDKVIEICHKLEAKEYYNAEGGKMLYSKEEFLKNGIELYFLRSKDVKYKQFNKDFISNLSIIDIMMFNSLEEIRKFLDQYSLE